MNYIVKQMYVNTNNRAVYKNMPERFLMLKLLDDFFSRTTLPVDQLLRASPPNARLSIFGVLKLNYYFSLLGTHIDRIGKITGFLQGGRVSATMYSVRENVGEIYPNCLSKLTLLTSKTQSMHHSICHRLYR
jgi:hypothetical protein